MEQDRLDREAVPAEVWVKVEVKEEAEWAGHLPQDREEIVSVPAVAIRSLTSQANHAIK
jgi:hypothetical protein